MGSRGLAWFDVLEKLTKPMTKRELALRLEVKPPTLNRHFRMLQEKKLIVFEPGYRNGHWVKVWRKTIDGHT